MTPKEKAEELVNRFIYRRTDYVEIDDAKQCALIAVDEIIYYLEITLGVDKEDFEYWQKVKEEIEKL
jgi:hypothetical protein